MANSEILTLIATAQDRASPALRQIQRALTDLNKAGVDLNKQTSALQNLNKAWAGLGEAARKSRDDQKHIREYGERFKQLGEHGKRAAEIVGKDVVPIFSTLGITSVTATGAILGLVEATKQFAEQSNRLANFGKSYGYLVRDLQGFEGVGKQFEVGTDVIMNSLATISREMDKVRGMPGMGGPDSLFNKLRMTPGAQGAAFDIQKIINTKDLSTAQQNIQVFMRLLREAKRIEEQPGPRGGAAYAGSFLEQYGIDRSNLRLTEEGMNGLEAALRRHQQLQGQLDPEKAKAYAKSMGELSSALEGLRNAIGTETLEMLTHLNEQITEFLAANNANIGKGIADAIREIAKAASESLPGLSTIKTIIDTIQQFNAASPGSAANRSATWLREHGGQQVGDVLSGAGSFMMGHGLGSIPQGAPWPKGPSTTTTGEPWAPPGGLKTPSWLPHLAEGAQSVTAGGLAMLHAGEQVRPAKISGAYGIDGGDPEQKRTQEENTKEIHELNQKLQKLIDDKVLGAGPGGAGRAGDAGGLGGGAGGGIGGGGGGAAGAAGAMYGGAGPGGGGGGGGGGSTDQPGAGQAGSAGTPGGAPFESSLAASKSGGYASALGGAEGSKFAASLPASHPAAIAAAKAAQQMSVGGALGGGAGAAGPPETGGGFSPAQTAAGGGGDAGAPGAATGGGSPYLAAQRADLFKNLSPQDKAMMGGLLQRENNKDPAGVLESMANRALAEKGTRVNRGGTLHEAMTNSFYGGNLAKARADAAAGRTYEAATNAAIAKVAGGSDQLEGRTDQGSLNTNRQARSKQIGGEWYSDKAGTGKYIAADRQRKAAYDAAHPNVAAPTASVAAATPPTGAGGVHPGAEIAPGARLAPSGKNPTSFIMHYTVGHPGVKGMANDWRVHRPGVGTQYFADREGNVHDVRAETGYGGTMGIHEGYVPKSMAAAGIANRNLVQMEIAAENEADITPQMHQKITDWYMKNYPNTPVMGHGEVNPGHRGKDEGRDSVAWIKRRQQEGAGQVPPAVASAPNAALKPWPTGAGYGGGSTAAAGSAPQMADPMTEGSFLKASRGGFRPYHMSATEYDDFARQREQEGRPLPGVAKDIEAFNLAHHIGSKFDTSGFRRSENVERQKYGPNFMDSAVKSKMLESGASIYDDPELRQGKRKLPDLSGSSLARDAGAGNLDAIKGPGYFDSDHPVGALGAKSEMTHKVEGSGKIDVNVNAPKGTTTKAAGGGMFNTVKVNRQSSMPHVDEQH